MSYEIFQLPKQVLISGAVVKPSWKVYFFLTTTTTPTPVYSDPALTAPLTQPVQADASGTLDTVYLDPAINYKASVYDQFDVLQYTVDPANTSALTAAGIGAILYPRTAAEIAASVTPVVYAYPPYNLLRYGADPTGVAAADTAIADWEAACDQADAEGVIPEGSYKITADIELPKKVRCSGTIAGSFNVVYQKRQYGWVIGLTCQKFYFRGCDSCVIERLVALTSVVMDGFNSTYGMFWNTCSQWTTTSLTIDITNWAVNSNQWYGGLIRYLHITGNNSTYAATEANSNVWDGVDFSNNALANYGVLQDDTVGHPNVLRNCYLEAGSNVRGNFHIFGHTMDGTLCLATHRLTHVLGAMSTTERDARDYLSLQIHNNARGGNWDWLDKDGKPPCLTAGAGTSSVSVVSDSTEPNNIGKAYEATLNGAFAQFQIAVKPSGLNRMCCILYYHCTTDFTSISVSDGSTNTDVDPSTWTIGGMADGWKLLRIQAHANPTGDTTITLAAQGASPSGSPVFRIGAMFAGQERAVLYPQKNDEYYSFVNPTGSANNAVAHAVGQFLEEQGASVVSVTATNPVTYTVTYQNTFAVSPLPSISFVDDGSANCANVTYVYFSAVSTTGFTAKIGHSGNFSGTVCWRASGNRI